VNIDEAIDKLKTEGREVQDVYVNHNGLMMVVIEGVALDYQHVIGLALGMPIEDVARHQIGG
jgi:hypothetical protein